MFCPKCGKQLPDDAIFCAECGSALRRAEQSAPAPQPAPQSAPVSQATPATKPATAPQPAPEPQPAPAPQSAPAPKSPAKKKGMPKFLSAKPSIWSWFCTFLAFLFAVMPIYTFSWFRGSFSMFRGAIFSISVTAGIGKIFMIIAILIFILRFAASLIDFNKLIKIKLNIEVLLQFVFLLCNLFVLFLAFLASIISLFFINSFYLWIWWYFSGIFTIGGLVLSFLPDLIKWPKE